MSVIYYHNPSCSKSRAGLTFLEEQNIKPQLRLYLNEPPSPQELKDIITKLNVKVTDILRSKEAAEVGISKDMSEEIILQLLSQNPRALERPILIIGNKAVIGRPTENIVQLVNDEL